MKTSIAFILFNMCVLFMSNTIGQEVPKKIVVEHFTNTKCSVCASRNPGFYSVLNQNPNVIHVAFHPSSPYSTCLFSTQNKAENDARTNWYGLYGGTPTFAINGTPKTIFDVTNTSVYQAYNDKTSPIDVAVSLNPSGPDSIEVSAVLRSVVVHDLENLQLYVILAEDTVFYNAPNGEKLHRDVFRKSFSGNNPMAITLGKQVGNQYVFTNRIKKNSVWGLKRCYAVAMLQDNNKNLIQAGVSNLYNEIISSTQDDKNNNTQLSVYPNPVSDFLNISLSENQIIKYVEIYGDAGKVFSKININQKTTSIDIKDLTAGLYIVKCVTTNGQAYFKKAVKI